MLTFHRVNLRCYLDKQRWHFGDPKEFEIIYNLKIFLCFSQLESLLLLLFFWCLSCPRFGVPGGGTPPGGETPSGSPWFLCFDMTLLVFKSLLIILVHAFPSSRVRIFPQTAVLLWVWYSRLNLVAAHVHWYWGIITSWPFQLKEVKNIDMCAQMKRSFDISSSKF